MDYTIKATRQIIDATLTSLTNNGYNATLVNTKSEALDTIKQIIPKGASVMNGSSTTLQQIGYMDYLSGGAHGWIDLHAEITRENDPIKRGALRKQSVSSDYYLGSMHALTQTGEFIVASNTGSQLPNIAFSSETLIFVVGTQKIVPTLSSAMDRLETYVYPLESDRSMKVYGVPSKINKVLIMKGENPMLKRHVHVILVDEVLGF